ncbi:MAG: hypothetical protein QNK31_01750 [Porticoccus sp.]|nr:hypothetical protein [Porticoccus sp.]
MFKPVFNSIDDEWVIMVGRYILNMGAIEMATRLLINKIEGTDKVPIFNDDLAARIAFIRKRFPQQNKDKHKSAMNTLGVANKHTKFRNIVAHSPISMTSLEDGNYHINGILDVTPKSYDTIAQLISIDELKCRVNESALVAKKLLEMQGDINE